MTLPKPITLDVADVEALLDMAGQHPCEALS